MNTKKECNCEIGVYCIKNHLCLKHNVHICNKCGGKLEYCGVKV